MGNADQCQDTKTGTQKKMVPFETPESPLRRRNLREHLNQAQRKTIPAGTRPLNTVSTVSPAHSPHPDRVTGPAIVLSILIGPDTKVWLVSQGSTPRDMAQ